MDQLLVLSLGLGIGLVSAILGLGGGVLIVPLLPSIVSLNQKEAIATSLLTILLVVTNNVISFHRQGLIVWRLALLVGPVTALGAFSASYFLASRLSDLVLQSILASLLFVLILRSVQNSFGPSGKDDEGSLKTRNRLSSFVLFVGMGLLAGSLSGLIGIGSGLIISPLLLTLGVVGHRSVVPTANAVMVFTTGFGALGFVNESVDLETFRWGYIHLDKATLLFAGAAISSYFGRRIQNNIPKNWRQWMMSLLLIGLCTKMIVDIVSQLI